MISAIQLPNETKVRSPWKQFCIEYFEGNVKKPNKKYEENVNSDRIFVTQVTR